MHTATVGGILITLVSFFGIIIIQAMPFPGQTQNQKHSSRVIDEVDLEHDDAVSSPEDDVVEDSEPAGRVHLKLDETTEGGHHPHAASEERHDKYKPLRTIPATVEKIESTTQRIRHIRLAAENLKQAEMDDDARQLIKKADGLEREVHAARIRLAPEMFDIQLRQMQQMQETMKDLQNTVERLRDDVNRLSHSTEKQ